MPQQTTDRLILRDGNVGATAVSLRSVLPYDYSKFEQQAPKRLITGINRCVDMFDPDNRKIKSIAVRRALGWAYPYQAAWAAAGGIQGVTRLPATNLEPVGTIGRTEYTRCPGTLPARPTSTRRRRF